MRGLGMRNVKEQSNIMWVALLFVFVLVSMTSCSVDVGHNVRPTNRSFESVSRVMDKNKELIYSIYMGYLQEYPNLGGQVRFELTIGSSGTVKNINILSNKLTEPNFAQKLVELIKSFDFGKKEGADTVITYPIDFIPKKI